MVGVGAVQVHLRKLSKSVLILLYGFSLEQ